jgi:putative ABC transport system substrate-binding protein
MKQFWILDGSTSLTTRFGFWIGGSKRDKVICFTLCTLLFALCVSAEAQPQAKIPRIGYLAGTGPESPNPNIEAFRQGLRDLGYIEGKNILVEYRYSEGNPDRYPSVVAELVQLKVDVFVATSLTAIRVAKQATKTIPIVMITTQDPVAIGLIDSLARPGGNITGLTRLTRELSGKRLDILDEMVPKISRIAILWNTKSEAAVIGFKEYDAAARALKIPLQSLEVRGPSPDLESAFQAASKGLARALITVRDTVLLVYRKQIADLALKTRLPSIYEGSEFIEAGGLLSYASSDAENFSRAAVFVDKILKGAKPAELPVEQPRKFELVINLKTAKQIGLTIPQSVLFRADRVTR